MHPVTPLWTNIACLPLCSCRYASSGTTYKMDLLLHVPLPKPASSSRAAMGSRKGLLHQCHNRNVTDICMHEDMGEKRHAYITSQRHELSWCMCSQRPSHGGSRLVARLLYPQRNFPLLLFFGVWMECYMTTRDYNHTWLHCPRELTFSLTLEGPGYLPRPSLLR